MKRRRIIPLLLIQDGGLVKSIKFRNHKYVGDPINAVKIFNEKEVDEIAVLNISATINNRLPDIERIREIASEAFMPLAYGGGISRLDEIEALVASGVEKVIINTSAFIKPNLVEEGARSIGSQSVVVSMDVKKNFWGKLKVFVRNGTTNTGIDPVTYAKRMENSGAGELMLMSIEKDGTFEGYDLNLVEEVSSAVNIPVIAAGGASTTHDFYAVIKNGASAAAAGSLFVFQRPHRAVLISYPGQQELKEIVFSKL